MGEFWPTTMYVLLVFLMAGYTLLDGYDLGVGILLPFFPRNPDRRDLLNALAPFWDGNEVWLIIAVGSLFAAFPAAYAAALTGFYVFAMLMLLVLILRAASFEFWYHSEKRQAWWGAVFSASSLFIPLLLGLLAGNAVLGLPLGQDDLPWRPGLVFRAFPLLTASTAVAAMIFQGLAFASSRTQPGLQRTILGLAGRFWKVYLAAALIFIAGELIFLPSAAGRWLFWLGTALAAAGFVFCARRLRSGNVQGLLGGSSVILSGLWIGLATAQYPALIRSSEPGRSGLDIANPASPIPALQIMSLLIVSGMVLVLLYTGYIHRVFRGKPEEGAGY